MTWLDFGSQGHSRPLRWRRYPHRCWGVKFHPLLFFCQRKHADKSLHFHICIVKLIW